MQPVASLVLIVMPSTLTLPMQLFSEEDIDFHRRILERSGLEADGTFLPATLNPRLAQGQPRTDINSAMDELRLTVVGAAEVNGLLH